MLLQPLTVCKSHVSTHVDTYTPHPKQISTTITFLTRGNLENILGTTNFTERGSQLFVTAPPSLSRF